MLKVVTWLIFVLTFCLQNETRASTTLSDVSAKRVGADFLLEMSFTQDISEKDVNLAYTNGTIELVVPNAVAPKKAFTSVNDAWVNHLFISQNPSGSLRCRVILSKSLKAKEFENSTTLSSRANKLYVRIGDPRKSPTKEVSSELIDQLMQKEANQNPKTTATPETAPPAMVTAESALPKAKEASSATVAIATVSDDSQPIYKNPPASRSEKVEVSRGLGRKMVVSLLIVFVMMGAAYYGFKKWPGVRKLTQKSRMIQILSQHALGPRKSLAVVRVAGETVLIGVTDNNISILKTLALLDEDIPSESAKAADSNLGKSQRFSSALSSKLGGPHTSEEEDFSMKGLRELVGERLKSMKEL